MWEVEVEVEVWEVAMEKVMWVARVQARLEQYPRDGQKKVIQKLFINKKNIYILKTTKTLRYDEIQRM